MSSRQVWSTEMSALSTFDPTRDANSLNKPVVVGLYGLSGSGKSYLLKELKQSMKDWDIYEGSELLEKHAGGLKEFKGDEKTQTYWREYCINWVQEECKKAGKPALVAGHLILWDGEGDEDRKDVHTDKDWAVYTHIIYLWNYPYVMARQRTQDLTRQRSAVSQQHLEKWQHTEMALLRQFCIRRGILFTALTPRAKPTLTNVAAKLLRDFQLHTEERNLQMAKDDLTKALIASKCHFKPKILVLDADMTLAAEDAGILFWNSSPGERRKDLAEDAWLVPGNPFRELFSGPLDHSYTAFRQSVLLCEDLGDDLYETICKQTASEIKLHPEMLNLLRLAAEQSDVGAVVITSGLRRVWEIVLDRFDLSRNVKVVGGGRVKDGYVVTAAVKGELVKQLCEVDRKRVLAFGDGPVDLPMLQNANRAIVVVGEEDQRSASMEKKLGLAIEKGLEAQQVLLPPHVRPRLDLDKLPEVNLYAPSFLDSVFSPTPLKNDFQIHIAPASKGSVQLLQTPTRDNTFEGPHLKEAHRNIGRYLATEYLTEHAIIGLEEYPINHVQGGGILGYRLRHERATLIVALMRAGEPMASGVSDAFPLARFLHAREHYDIELVHLENIVTVILVDSVINNGDTMKKFVNRIRRLNASLPIVIVANVVQKGVIDDKRLEDIEGGVGKLSLVALRTSATKFTGTKAIDTGNRLFNTKHMK